MIDIGIELSKRIADEFMHCAMKGNKDSNHALIRLVSKTSDINDQRKLAGYIIEKMSSHNVVYLESSNVSRTNIYMHCFGAYLLPRDCIFSIINPPA